MSLTMDAEGREALLTIAEAKRCLAITFNVDPANVEILVEG